VTLALPSAAFARAREVLVVVDGYRIVVRVSAAAPPAGSRFEWMRVVDAATGLDAMPSEIRRQQSDGDFRARVHRAAHSMAATGRQGG